MSEILITGGSGFIGDALMPVLVAKGYEPIVFTRDVKRSKKRHGQLSDHLRYIFDFDQLKSMPWAVINLAGAGIADRRWTDARKRLLRDSRIGVTERLVQRLGSLNGAPEKIISGSAVGYYGPLVDAIATEKTGPGSDFSALLCSDWEGAIAPLGLGTAALSILRIGVVLGRPGGFLGRLEPVFRLGAGGPLGDGQQMFSWIHRDDLVNLMVWCLEHSTGGIYNATSPGPVSNEGFTRALGRTLRRPTIFRIPEHPARWILGDLASLLFEGQAVRPKAAIDEGFIFNHPDLDEALADLFR